MMCIKFTVQICMLCSFSSIPMYLSLLFAIANLLYYQVSVIYLKYLKINFAPYVSSFNIRILSVYSEWVTLQTALDYYRSHFFISLFCA